MLSNEIGGTVESGDCWFVSQGTTRFSIYEQMSLMSDAVR